MPSVSLAASFALALALTACTTEPPSPLPPDVAEKVEKTKKDIAGGTLKIEVK